MKKGMVYAGLRERSLALMIDALLFFACFLPVTRTDKGVWLMWPNEHHWFRGWFIFDPLCLAFLVVVAIHFMVLAGWLGATIGRSISTDVAGRRYRGFRRRRGSGCQADSGW